MLLTYQELVKVLGLSILQILIYVFGAFLFSILLILKVEETIDLSWLVVFAPLFTADGLAAYFAVIVFIRYFISPSRNIRKGIYTSLLNVIMYVLLLICKILLVQRLEGANTTFTVATIPLILLMQIFVIKSCCKD